MKNLYCKDFYINDEFYISSEILSKRYKTQETKLITLLRYKNNKLVINDSIKVKIIKTKETFKIGEVVAVRQISENWYKEKKEPYKGSTTTILGKGTIKDINDNEYIIENIYFAKENINRLYVDENDKVFSKNICDLFKLDNITIDEFKNNYIPGLFKIYYDSMLIQSRYSQNISSNSSKLSAMASYCAIYKWFEENNQNKFILSTPNCFIKNCNVEIDALLLDKNKYNNYNKINTTEKHFISKENVKAILEIKSCGIFNSKTSLKKEFEDYILHEDKKNNDIEYKDIIDNSNIKYIYFAIYERTNYYNICKKVINSLDSKYRNRFYGIFCSISSNNSKFEIPEYYNIYELINKI